MAVHQIVIEERARRDIRAYAEWLSIEASPAIAHQWVDAIEAAITSIERMPSSCGVGPESEAVPVTIRQLLFHSHRILFTIKGRAVHVLHVRHGARLPGLEL